MHELKVTKGSEGRVGGSIPNTQRQPALILEQDA